jgi:pantetheine-phosphate adenylyltransferase
MKKAVYPGSFDPITNGHVDIIERASVVFDEVTVLIALNPQKRHLFTKEERVNLAKESLKHIPNVKVDAFDGLVYEYAIKNDAKFIIRGLRTLTDYQAENQLFEFNYNLSNKRIDTIAFFSDSNNTFVASSIIKEIAQFGGDYHKYVPSVVANALKEKYKK